MRAHLAHLVSLAVAMGAAGCDPAVAECVNGDLHVVTSSNDARCVIGDVFVEIASASLPALRSVGGSFNTQGVSSLDLPALTSVTGDFHIVAAGPTIGAPALAHTANFVVTQDQSGAFLTALDFPALRVVDGAFVADNIKYLQSLDFPALTTVRTAFRVSFDVHLQQCRVDQLLAQLEPPPPVIETGGNDGTPCP